MLARDRAATSRFEGPIITRAGNARQQRAPELEPPTKSLLDRAIEFVQPGT